MSKGKCSTMVKCRISLHPDLYRALPSLHLCRAPAALPVAVDDVAMLASARPYLLLCLSRPAR